MCIYYRSGRLQFRIDLVSFLDHIEPKEQERRREGQTRKENKAKTKQKEKDEEEDRNEWVSEGEEKTAQPRENHQP